jgi:hypothetical protein
MTTAEFKRLKDLLMRAAATDSDPELVQCFKRASVLLATHGHTWAQAMDLVVRVFDPVTTIEEDEGENWEELFEKAMTGASGSFLEILESIYEQWQKGKRLSPRQEEVVRAAAEHYHD